MHALFPKFFAGVHSDEEYNRTKFDPKRNNGLLHNGLARCSAVSQVLDFFFFFFSFYFFLFLLRLFCRRLLLIIASTLFIIMI